MYCRLKNYELVGVWWHWKPELVLCVAVFIWNGIILWLTGWGLSQKCNNIGGWPFCTECKYQTGWIFYIINNIKINARNSFCCCCQICRSVWIMHGIAWIITSFTFSCILTQLPIQFLQLNFGKIDATANGALKYMEGHKKYFYLKILIKSRKIQKSWYQMLHRVKTRK